MNDSALLWDMKHRLEIIEAKVNCEGTRAADAVNDFAHKVNEMMRTVNDQNKANIEAALDAKFLEITEAINELYSTQLKHEEVLKSLIKLAVVEEDLTPEENDDLVNVFTDFLTADDLAVK